MAEKYDEKEIREDYRKLTKLLIEKTFSRDKMWNFIVLRR